MEVIKKKLLVSGDDGCGKRCLLVTFYENQFPAFLPPTLFENCNKDIDVDGKKVELALWLSLSCNGADKLRSLLFPGTNVIIICFSIASPDSLENVYEKWWPETRTYCPNVPIILVGNKKDLRDDEQTIYELSKRNQAPITWEEGRIMSKKIKAFSYVECSAMKYEGVQEVFETATRATATSAIATRATVVRKRMNSLVHIQKCFTRSEIK